MLDATESTREPCRTRVFPCWEPPRVRSWPRWRSLRLVRRFGTEARTVLDNAVSRTGLSEAELAASGPGASPSPQLIFGLTHEGAHDVDDLLDRRTRVGLVPADRAAALPLARRALDLVRRNVAVAP